MFLSSHQDLDLDHREQNFLCVLGFVPMGFGQIIARIDCAFMFAQKSSQTFISQGVVIAGCWLAMFKW